MCPDLLLFVSFLPIIIHTSVAQGHLWTDKLQDIVLQKLLNQSWRITKKKGVTDVAKQKDIEEIAKLYCFPDCYRLTEWQWWQGNLLRFLKQPNV